jgi:hypothetical protein
MVPPRPPTVDPKTSPLDAPHATAFALTLRLTAQQQQWLDNAARFLAEETGCPVSHSSILMRLMENGLPQFERELEELRARSNAAKKRFPRLQLIHTQHRTAKP